MPVHVRPFLTLSLALITFLVLRSGPASAEWVAVGITDNATIYVGPDTIRRKGDLVTMWQLYDYKTVQTVVGSSHLSSKIQSQYDCLEERHRRLASAWFSGNMGNGNVALNNSDEGMWAPIIPESVSQALWKFACGKQ